MTDSQNQGQTETNPEGQNSGGNTDPEESFWKKFDERIDGAIKRNVENYRKQARTGTSRSGRTTLPGILADFVFGPAPKD